MKDRFANIPIQRKMLLSYISLFAISLLAFLAVLVSSLKRNVTTELNHMKQSNGQLSLYLDKTFEGLEGFCHFHFSDAKIENLILYDNRDIDLEEYQETKENLEASLRMLSDMQPHVLRTTLVTADGRVYKNIKEDQTDYINRMQKLANYVEWKRGDSPYVCELRKEKINLVSYKVISIIQPIWSIIGEEPAGYIFIDLDFNKLQQQWKQTADIKEMTEFMVLSRNHVLYDSSVGENKRVDTSDTEVVKIRSKKSGDGIFRIHGIRCVVSVEDYEICGWNLVQYIPVSYFVQIIIENAMVLIILLTAVIIATVVVSYSFSKQVSYPVRVLSEAMEKVAVDAEDEREIPFFENAAISQKDEIGKIVQSYNAMAKRINDNIIKTYHYRLRQKQTELLMLQFQINPHFMYNALNTISAIAKLENVDYIAQISSNLSDMFRYNISGKQIVTIDKELEHTLNYMNIQMIRFPNRFQVLTEVEDSLKKCRILKFVLQPIVENCYKYAFPNRKKDNVIQIKIMRKEDDVILTIEDNGVGIPEEKVSRLNESFQRTMPMNESEGIGLHNVNYRLKNYYGDAYGITVESEKNYFTRISLRIRYTVELIEESGNDKSNSSRR